MKQFLYIKSAHYFLKVCTFFKLSKLRQNTDIQWIVMNCLQGSPRNKSRSEFRRSAWQALHADNVSKGCQEKFFVVLSSFVHPSEKPTSMQQQNIDIQVLFQDKGVRHGLLWRV